MTGRVLDAHDIAAQVLEMWGYNIAARNMGIRHLDWQDLQVSQLQHIFVRHQRYISAIYLRRWSLRASVQMIWMENTSIITLSGLLSMTRALPGG